MRTPDFGIRWLPGQSSYGMGAAHDGKGQPGGERREPESACRFRIECPQHW